VGCSAKGKKITFFIVTAVRTSNPENKQYYVKFEVFTAVTMKNAVFWDVALCRSCLNRRFGGTYRLQPQSAATCSRWLLARGFFYPEDGGDTFLQNVGSHKIYTAPHPRRRHSSNSIVFSSFSSHKQ
jgi:hypothetical protein